MERARIRLFGAIAVCGLLIIALSFLPWVRFHSEALGRENILGVEGPAPEGVSIHLPGTETSRLRDLETIERSSVQEDDGWCSCRVSLGDGYLTAALGVLLIGGAALALFARLDRPGAAIGVVASLLALGVAGFNAIADWQALAWTEAAHLEAVQGTVQPALIVLMFTAALTAIASAVAWSLSAPLPLEDEWDGTADDEGDFLATEGIEAWA